MDTSQPYRRREFKLARDVHLRRPDFRPIPILVTLYENRITSPVMRGLRSHSPLHQEDVFGLVEGVRILIMGVAIDCATFTLVAQTWRGSDHAYRSNQLCRILNESFRCKRRET